MNSLTLATSQPHHHNSKCRGHYKYMMRQCECDPKGVNSSCLPPNANRRGKMNTVDVEGGTKKQRRLVENLVNWCYNRLTPRHRTIHVNVELTTDIPIDGECSRGGERNEFDIIVYKKLKDDDFITTILHEMVHVMQYATGKMKDLNNQGSTVYWRGYNYSNYEYRRQPWERQAYRYQEILLREWKKYVGSNKCCRCVSST